jgi:hypothetical protein
MQPAVLGAATLEKLISAAIAAPSIHNTQPWRYRLDPDTATLEVRSVAERSLRYADPLGQALHLSVGAGLFNLRVAVAHFGWEPVVRLLPDPADPALLGTIRLAGPLRGDIEHCDDLYDVIWRRHTSRFPFSDERLPHELLDRMVRAAEAEGVRLSLPDAAETTRLLRLTTEAEMRDTTDPDRRAESRGWLREAGTLGMYQSALGPLDVAARLPMRDFSGLRPAGRQAPAVFERLPTVAVMATAADRPADWLRVGQALEHVLLIATAWKVRASLMHQALEWPDLRWALRDVHSGPSHVQMLIRLGYGPEGPATPRQPASEALEGGLPEGT